MLFQLLLYDFIVSLTFRKLVKYLCGLIILAYYTAYHAIERGHPGLHKAQILAIWQKYVPIWQPYEPFFLPVCGGAIALFSLYMAYSYSYCKHRKGEGQCSMEKSPAIQELVNNAPSYKSQELLFLKEQVQLIQRRIEAIERG